MNITRKQRCSKDIQEAHHNIVFKKLGMSKKENDSIRQSKLQKAH
jgi:hypothetical protein